MRSYRTVFIASLLMAAPCAAIAQAPPSPATPPQQTAPPPAQHSTNCAPTRPDHDRGTLTPDGTTTGEAREPLADKLAQSNGVLCPPSGVDPQMRAPTPDTGKMPVIPPPGSPGGDPNVRPK